MALVAVVPNVTIYNPPVGGAAAAVILKNLDLSLIPVVSMLDKFKLNVSLVSVNLDL